MESAGVRYLCTRFCIRNRTSEHSERVHKYRTKRFPCGIVFIIYVVVNFLSQVIFVFLLFLGMIMYANEVETKEK